MRRALRVIAGAALLTGLLAAAAPLRAAEVSARILVQDRSGAALGDAIVYAVPTAARARETPPPATIDQVQRQFVPRVSVVQVGTEVRFPNSDNVRHSVYSFSPAKTFTRKLYAGQVAPSVTFDRPGLVVLGCNIHDSMVGFVLVVDSPFYARTDARGHAVLEHLTAGDYELSAWHEPMAAPSAPMLLRATADRPETVLVLDTSGATQ